MSVSIKNSSIKSLNAGQNFTGAEEDCSAWSILHISFKADSNCTITREFSPNGTDWDFSATDTVNSSVPYSKSVEILAKYMRMLVVNTSTTNQTFLRLQTILRKESTGNDIDSISHETSSIVMYGSDGISPKTIRTDSKGDLQVDVLTMPNVGISSMPANLDIRSLTNTQDNILLFGYNGTTNKKVLVNTDGVLLTHNISVSNSYKNIDVNNKSKQVGVTGTIKIHNIAIFNRSGAERYFKLYNCANATQENTPMMIFVLYPQSQYTVNYSTPIEFSTALCIRATTGITDGDNSSPSTNEVIVNIAFSQ